MHQLTLLHARLGVCLGEDMILQLCSMSGGNTVQSIVSFNRSKDIGKRFLHGAGSESSLKA